MAKSQILTGARAKILISAGDSLQVVGLFANCSWSVRQEKVPAYTLGRHNPSEITPTSQEPVQLTLTGYRVVNQGPYAVANATKLRGLLDEEDFTVMVIDRRGNTPIFTAIGCRVLGWSSGVAARGVSDIRLEVIGLIAWDEYSNEKGDGEADGATSITG